MKRNFTMILALGFCSLVSAQQAPNSDFEIWQKDTMGSEPNNWYTSNVLSTFMGGTPGTEKKAGSMSNFSAKLTTTGDPMAPNFATLSNTPITSLQSFPLIPGGFAYTQSPDSFFFDAQYDIQAGDSALIGVIFKKNGSPFPVTLDMFKIAGTQNSWKTIGFKLSPIFVAPDSVVIIFTSSNYLDQTSAVVGSTISIDNIRFSTADQVVNGTLENWTDIIYEHPQGWNSIDALVATLGINTTSKSTEVHGGNFAVRLENKAGDIFGSTDTFPGIIGSAEIEAMLGNDLNSSGFPYTSNYTKLMGYYKYTSAGNDSAAVGILFGKNGVTTDSFLVVLPPSAQYRLFELPISYQTTPDSAMIVMGAGRFSMDPDADPTFYPGSVLFVDDIQLNKNPLSAGNIINVRAFDLYPNPSTGSFNLVLELAHNETFTYEVTDLSGKKVIATQAIDLPSGENTLKVNLENQVAGVYFLSVNGEGFTRTFKLVVK